MSPRPPQTHLKPASMAAIVGLALATPVAAGQFRNIYSSLPVGSSYSVLSVIESAGGFVASGNSSGQAFLIKVDAVGGTVFLNTYGNFFSAPGLDERTGGGFILAGEELSYDNPSLLAVDASGAPLWSNSYDLGYAEQGFYVVHQTPDGGYLASGISTLKVDSSGVPLWSTLHIGGGGNVNGSAITTDGGALITGEGQYGNTAGDYNLVLTRMDSGGAITWNQVYAGEQYDWSANVRETRDGGAIVTGWTGSFGTGNRSCFLLKTDSLGAIVWANTYSGTASSECRGVVQTVDGGYAMTGAVDSTFFLAKTDPAGALTWAKTYGGSSLGYALRETSDGGFIAAGISNSSLTLIKTDALGDALTCNQADAVVAVTAAPFKTGSNTQNSPMTWTSKVLSPTVNNPAVTFQNLCSGSCTPSVNAQVTPTDACAGSAINLTATGSTIPGCTVAVEYRWRGSAGFLRDWSTVASASDTPLISNTYTLDLRCTNPVCQGSAAGIPVVIHELPTTDAGAAQRMCAANTAVLGGAPTASGGSPPYLYTWNSLPADASMSCTSSSTCSNPTVSPAVATSYTLTVIDSAGCSAIPATTQLAVDANPLADAGAARSLCLTQSGVLGGSPTAQGGNGPYDFAWSALPADPSMSCTSGAACSNPTVTPDVTTTYTVDITDANGCTARSSVTVTVTSPAAPPGVGNTLLVVKDLLGFPPDRTSIVLSWAAAGGSAISDHLRRSDSKSFAPPNGIVVTVAPGLGARLPSEVTSLPAARYYRTTTSNCAGVESPI